MPRFARLLNVLRDDGFLALARQLLGRLGGGSNPGNKVGSTNLAKLERWRALKDLYKGERAFLVGNGPSLNITPLHLLQDEFTLCFNRFNLMFERLNWMPDMYMCVDERVAEDMAPEINAFVNRFRYAVFPDVHPGGVDFREFIGDGENVFWLSLDWGGFYQDLPRCGLGGTVANVGLQVLSFMGFSPIYLVGVDMDYKDHETALKEDQRNWTSVRDDDPNHFDPRYFGTGRKYHYPRVVENMLPSLERAKDITDSLGIQVLNAGVGGLLETFPRVEFSSLFSLSYEEELRLLLDAVDPNAHGSSLEEAFPNARRIETSSVWPLEAPVVIAGSQLAEQLIPKVIFTHIPYGPINDRHLFIKRDGPNAAR
ncbi:MAG: DUF115 domain-containing protein [Deltaproteobacteria bacterium]|nr:MAG: DUF115 domain-containing protein [Deltaproteobacteria bacterium]